METLDLLIKKFQEFKEELNKPSTDNDTNLEKSAEELEKFYISPYKKYGPAKVNPPPAKPAKTGPTGSDKIAAVSKEPIQAMNAKVVKPTGLDRIKAESQKPITAMDAKVKKDEDEEKDDLDKGLFGSSEAKKPFTPSFKGHKAALGVGSKTDAKGVTTNTSYDPASQKVSTAKYMAPPPGFERSCDEKISMAKNGQWKLDKTVNESVDSAPNGSGLAMSEKVDVAKNGQWNLKKDGLQDAIKNLKSSTKVTSAMNTLRTPVAKEERCSKCHASPCQCQTTGTNVD